MSVLIVLQQEPADELLAATIKSASLGYVVDINNNTGSATRPNVDARLEVEFWINGSKFGVSEYYDVSTYSYLGGNIHQYRFSFDAQKNIQAYFDQNADTLLDLFRGLQSSSSSTNYAAQFHLEFYAWVPNADDLLEKDLLTTEVSNDRFAINAVLNHSDIQNLNAYDRPTISPTPAEWLTDKPEELNVVCRDADEQLAGWGMGLPGDTQGITFRGYNNLGVQISVGSKTGIFTLQNGLTIFPVGPQNIINTTGWTITPPILPNAPAMKYYTITISQANYSVTRTYYLKDSCCNTHNRLYFRNRLGCYDTLDIFGNELETYTTQSSQFERQRGFEYSEIGRGINRIQTLGRQGWGFVRIRFTKAQAQWARQLLLSTNIFRQTKKYDGSGGYYLQPVFIRDVSELPVFDKGKQFQEFSFFIDNANSDISQRN